QDEARRTGARLGDGLVARDGHARDVVAEGADNSFDVHGDNRLVLDDQDVREGLAFDLLERLGDEAVDVPRSGTDEIGGILGRETLEPREQEGRARAGRDTRAAR